LGRTEYERFDAGNAGSHVRRLSLAALERLALEAERQGTQRAKVAMVVVKRRAAPDGRPVLVVMTAGARSRN